MAHFELQQRLLLIVGMRRPSLLSNATHASCTLYTSNTCVRNHRQKLCVCECVVHTCNIDASAHTPSLASIQRSQNWKLSHSDCKAKVFYLLYFIICYNITKREWRSISYSTLALSKELKKTNERDRENWVKQKMRSSNGRADAIVYV